MSESEKQLSRDLRREDLFERLGWLIRLRWLAAAGLLATILFARYALHLHVEMRPLLLANGALAGCNVVYHFVWERQWGGSIRSLVRFGIVQTVVDYIVLTVVLHYSGGVENPLLITFVFQCIIASMLFSAGLSYFLAALAVALVSAMVVLERVNLWPHVHLSGYLPSELAIATLFVPGALVTLAVVLFVSVYLTTTIERASRRRSSEAARRSAQLEKAREQMRRADKMTALGELAASMAHDINNPAGVICTRLDVMEAEGAFENLPDRLRHDLATLRECAQYLRRVAGNWSGFTRKIPPHIGRLDLNDVVRRTVAMVEESLAPHRVRLTLNLHDSALWVRGDLVRVQQVVLNLVNNAREAMPEGGTLTISTRLSHSSDRQSGIVMEVRDTGSGIAPADLDRIFEPFFSGKPKDQGTGLGLAICQKIVREMEGEISVQSRLGEGTVFSIRLPAYSPPQETGAYDRD